MRRGGIHEKGDDQPEGELEASGMVAEGGELEASGMVAEEGELEASGMVSTIFYLGFHILCNIKGVHTPSTKFKGVFMPLQGSTSRKYLRVSRIDPLNHAYESF